MKKENEKLTGVTARDGNYTIQLAEGLTFGEAFSMVIDLRSKKDGKFYKIGVI